MMQPCTAWRLVFGIAALFWALVGLTIYLAIN